jgi:hypothetical protein
MKQMNQIGDYILVILDGNNYVVYDQRKDYTDKKTKKVAHNYSFHTTMEQAEERLSRDWADEVTSDTVEWHEAHRGALETLRFGTSTPVFN